LRKRTSKFPLQKSSPVKYGKEMNKKAAAKYQDLSNAFEINQDVTRLPIIKEENVENEEIKDCLNDSIE
jgi:ribosomal protein S6